MSFGCHLLPPSHVSTLPKAWAQQRVAGLPAPKFSCVCRLGNPRIHQKASKSVAQHPVARPLQPLPPPLSRLLAGCSATMASLFFPLLPSWASESFDYMSDNYLDPNVAESPDVLSTLLIVVVAYFTVMLLYLWLSSFLDEDADSNAQAGDSKQQQQPPPADQGGDLPPGYGSFLNAHVRSYVSPHSRPVRALQALEQAEPLEGEQFEQYKGRLAAGAAEALDQQIRDCERLVRTKLLARKLGYAPSNAADKGDSSSSSSSSPGSSYHQQQQPPPSAASDVYHLLSSHVFSSPLGLSSPEHRAEIEALIEQQLHDLLPPGGGSFHDELIVRQVMRRLVGHLVMEESLLLLEGMEHGRKQLEATGRTSKPGDKHWALW